MKITGIFLPGSFSHGHMETRAVYALSRNVTVCGFPAFEALSVFMVRFVWNIYTNPVYTACT